VTGFRSAPFPVSVEQEARAERVGACQSSVCVVEERCRTVQSGLLSSTKHRLSGRRSPDCRRVIQA